MVQSADPPSRKPVPTWVYLMTLCQTNTLIFLEQELFKQISVILVWIHIVNPDGESIPYQILLTPHFTCCDILTVDSGKLQVLEDKVVMVSSDVDDSKYNSQVHLKIVRVKIKVMVLGAV